MHPTPAPLLKWCFLDSRVKTMYSNVYAKEQHFEGCGPGVYTIHLSAVFQAAFNGDLETWYFIRPPFPPLSRW